VLLLTGQYADIMTNRGPCHLVFHHILTYAAVNVVKYSNTETFNYYLNTRIII